MLIIILVFLIFPIFWWCIAILLYWFIIYFSVSYLFNTLLLLHRKLFWILKNQLCILFCLCFLNIKIDIQTLRLQNIQMSCSHAFVSKMWWFFKIIHDLSWTFFRSTCLIFISNYRLIITINGFLLYITLY